MDRKKILIVDDSPTVRRQITDVLVGAGFNVIEAFDGVRGIELLSQHDDLSLIILDVNMPRMNGLDMLERVKADGQNANLPVLMLTSEGHRSLIRRAMKAGAKGWIVKPFERQRFISAIQHLTAA